MSPLTPYDIHNKEFKRSFRGYDVDEVNDFLDQIIKDFELLTREKLELEQQVEDLQAELERVMEGQAMYSEGDPQATQPQPTQQHQQHQQHQSQHQQTQTHMPPARYNQQTELQPSVASLSSMEQSIHKSIRVAQEVAEEVRLNAKKEAELIVQEAEKNADRIINEALQKARAIHSELLDLKQKATVYRARFRTLVQSHLDILENSDWESLEELEANLEEHGQQLEQYATETNPDLLLEQQPHEYQQLEDPNMTGVDSNMTGIDPNMTGMMDEVAPTFMEEEEEPRRELRRTTRKLKKKAMF